MSEHGPKSELHELPAQAEALWALAAFPGGRLLINSLTEMDRTMDNCYGLLDRMSNPTPSFQVARILKSLLFGVEHEFQAGEVREENGYRDLSLGTGTSRYRLLLPKTDDITMNTILDPRDSPAGVRCYDLERGERILLEEIATANREGQFGPVAIVYESGAA